MDQETAEAIERARQSFVEAAVKASALIESMAQMAAAWRAGMLLQLRDDLLFLARRRSGSQRKTDTESSRLTPTQESAVGPATVNSPTHSDT